MKIKLPFLSIFFFLILSLIFFATRFTNLMTLPIFTDEAIYVRWSQIAKNDAQWRFISLTDGKQPSFIWATMSSMRVIEDPLLAARVVSVFAGFGTLVGIMLLSWELFKKQKTEGSVLSRMFGHLKKPDLIGFISGILFVFFPFALVYDRLAIYDSTVACTIIWAIYLTVMLVRYVRLDLGLLFGFIAGSAMLTKTSGFFSIYLLPFSLILFNWKQKHVKGKLFELLFFMLCGVAVAYLMYAILRLSPFFYIIDEKNGLFVWQLSEWITKNPIEIFIGNFKGLFDWLVAYVSFPVLLLAFASFIAPMQRREKLFLFVWFLIPFLGLTTLGKTIYPRFIYFMTLPLLILASVTLTYLYEKVKRKFYFYLAIILIIVIYIRVDYFVIFDFARAPIPQADLFQLINSWPAGGGIKEMLSFFEKEAVENGKIYVATQGTFGSLPTYSMEIYLGDNTNIETRGIYPLPTFIPEDLTTRAKTIPVYLVLNDSEDPPVGWPLTFVAKYQKGIGDRHLSIYRVNP